MEIINKQIIIRKLDDHTKLIELEKRFKADTAEIKFVFKDPFMGGFALADEFGEYFKNRCREKLLGLLNTMIDELQDELKQL